MSRGARLRAAEAARRRLGWRCPACGRGRAEVDALVVRGLEVGCGECLAEVEDDAADCESWPMVGPRSVAILGNRAIHGLTPYGKT